MKFAIFNQYLETVEERDTAPGSRVCQLHKRIIFNDLELSVTAKKHSIL